MKPRSSYLGVDPAVVKCVKYHAWRGECSGRLDHLSLDDIQQELLCSILPSLNKYEEDKGSFATLLI